MTLRLADFQYVSLKMYTDFDIYDNKRQLYTNQTIKGLDDD